jgi:hypothetical protein
MAGYELRIASCTYKVADIIGSELRITGWTL